MRGSVRDAEEVLRGGAKAAGGAAVADPARLQHGRFNTPQTSRACDNT